jgi:diamine N-acetyltransferase
MFSPRAGLRHHPIHPEDNEMPEMPDRFDSIVTLRSGESLLFRPLEPGDAPALADYFAGLSAETRRRYAPHEFTEACAQQLCAQIDHRETMRLLALTREPAPRRIVAYFILKLGVRPEEQARYAALNIPLDGQTDCSLAPSVADAYQDLGLGSLMMRWMFEVAGRLGRRRVVLWGGCQITNARAIHFYQKHGFTKVGEYSTTIDYWDMIRFSI